MDADRNMISSAVQFPAAGEQVFLFGSSGGAGGFLGGARPVVGAGGGAVDYGRRKRPFQLTAQEELQLQLQLQLVGDDELGGYDYELHHGPQERATKRRLTAEQVRELELSFEEDKRKLEPERKSELARRLGIAPRQVAVWFQNRRARWRTKQLEQDFDRLRAAHDDLLAGRDALLADNDRLRSQVITLTEKLQAKESSPASDPEEQAVAVQAAVYALFKEDELRTEVVAGGGAAQALGVGTKYDSPESYFAGARSPPSSSEEDCGGGNDDRAFVLPDALLAAAVEHGIGRAAEEDDAQLNNWAWLWNEQQY